MKDCPFCNPETYSHDSYREESVLTHLLSDHSLTQEEIGSLFDIEKVTVSKWCRKNGIDTYEVRTPEEVWKSEEFLRREYHENDKSMLQISEEQSVPFPTLQYWFNKYDIDRRGYSEAHNLTYSDRDYRDRGALYSLYWEEGLTQREIADEMDVGFTTVQKWMSIHDIPLRYTGVSGKCYPTENGETVRSSVERDIANFLFYEGIRYEYEPSVPGTTKKADFLVDGVYIEYWGMAERDAYQERMEGKQELYESLDIDVINLYPEDVPHLGEVLSPVLTVSD